MKSVFRVIAVIFAGLILIYSSLLSLSSAQETTTSKKVAKILDAERTPISKEQAARIDELPFRDNPAIYQNDDPASVVTIYLTVRKGNSSDNSDYTWTQINDFTKDWVTTGHVVTVGKAEAIVQFGNENGLLPGEVGYDALVPNANIQIRGSTTSLAPQKSYKIELLKNVGAWRGQSTINLNKHIYDPTRFRNKLSFDLLKDIPDMISLRTQFVHLYVKDETSDPVQTQFEDYGLFTQVEQPNKKFLISRFLDRDAQLYKANDFEFYRYPDQIRSVDDPSFDEDSFSLRLEIKGNKDHTKLIQMLDDVNNKDIPIEQTFEKYFNSDNYFTWMAFNILVGNLDTNSQNFFLYSPKNGNKWYFTPWDYDDSFPLQNQPDLLSYKIAPWQNGVSNYWGVVLHNRVLRVEKYRGALSEKINEIKAILTPEKIRNLISIYQPIVDQYTSVLPDSYYMPATPAKSHQIADLMPDDIETNYNLYLESLKKPMPFYLGVPEVSGSKINFYWDEAYDFEGQAVTYHFILGRDWTFKDVVYDQSLTNTTTIQIDMLPPGEYYWGVTATNASGNTQVPFDNYYDTDSQLHPGLKRFYITPKSEVLE